MLVRRPGIGGGTASSCSPLCFGARLAISNNDGRGWRSISCDLCCHSSSTFAIFLTTLSITLLLPGFIDGKEGCDRGDWMLSRGGAGGLPLLGESGGPPGRVRDAYRLWHSCCDGLLQWYRLQLEGEIGRLLQEMAELKIGRERITDEPT